MSVKKTKPNTPGQRFRIAPDFSSLTKGQKPHKSLTYGLRKSGGRNSKGRMTMRYMGGGHKRRYRFIDLRRQKYNVEATVKTIEYDPNRTARIALIYYSDGEKSYILAPQGLVEGQKIVSGEKVVPEVGNAMPLKAMPTGTIVHNIELRPGQGGVMARTAGASARLVAKADRYVTLKLPSGETRMVLADCLATVGVVSNSQHGSVRLGKAGRKRWLGRRPRVRGVAMNPVDHKMGGGEGKASGGHPSSRKGLYAKGKKTRNRKKKSSKLILKRK